MAEFIFENNEDNNVVDDLEEKRESILVLSTLGMTKEYLGEELGVDKIYKLSKESIEKYFNRYQLAQGKKVSDVMMEKGIQLGINMLSHFLPIDDQMKLVNVLKNDHLVNRELSNIIGHLVLKGGRLVANYLIQIANHVAVSVAGVTTTSEEPYQDTNKSCQDS